VRDSCGISGTGETPAGLNSLGGSPHAPRKASILKRKSTTSKNNKGYEISLYLYLKSKKENENNENFDFSSS
jgi:hypothetical protein